MAPPRFCRSRRLGDGVDLFLEMAAAEEVEVADDDASCSDTLNSNYRSLPDHLKFCFHRICLFRVLLSGDYIMRSEWVIWYLMTQEQAGEMMTEETARDSIDELLHRGMIQEKERYYGRRTYLKVPEQLYQLVFCEGEEDFNGETPNSPAHAFIDLDEVSSIPLQLTNLPIRSLSVRSLERISPVDLATICGLQFLSVLKITSGDMEFLPDEVGNLIHLRMLILNCLCLEKLPATIGNLQKLQTLYIAYCTKKFRLPTQVLNILNLSHLSVFEGGFRWVPKEIGRLVNLRTLEEVYAGGGIATQLSALTQLRKLGIVNLSEDHSDELLAAIAKMEKLTSLRLKAETTHFQGEDLTYLPELESFSPPPLIKELVLDGGLMELPIWLASMANLTLLWLRGSKLSENPTLVLQFLPKLKSLSLEQAYTKKVIGKEFCAAGGFPALETLAIASYDLMEWTEIVDGTFPCLRKLAFRCRKLRFLPEGLKNISTLNKLYFKWSANQDLIRRLKGEENYKIKHISKFKYPNC